jgi:hypothetical protein
MWTSYPNKRQAIPEQSAISLCLVLVIGLSEYYVANRIFS